MKTTTIEITIIVIVIIITGSSIIRIFMSNGVLERERERERRERKGEASSAEQSENFIRFNAHEYVENAQTYTYTFVHTFAHQPLIPTLYMFVTRRGGRKA